MGAALSGVLTRLAHDRIQRRLASKPTPGISGSPTYRFQPQYHHRSRQWLEHVWVGFVPPKCRPVAMFSDIWWPPWGTTRGAFRNDQSRPKLVKRLLHLAFSFSTLFHFHAALNQLGTAQKQAFELCIGFWRRAPDPQCIGPVRVFRLLIRPFTWRF